MVDFFDSLYSSINNKYSFLDKIKYYSVYRFFVRLLSNLVIPYYFKISRNNSTYKLGESFKANKRIIVSLTSFPLRIDKVWIVIESILRQECKPDKIILWLSKEQFPTLDSLPKNLRLLRKRGLEVKLREKDLRSHKKYYYAFKEFPEDTIITIDDDIIYSPKLLKNLLLLSDKNPESICCNHGSEILIEGKNISSYKDWKHIKGEVTNSNRLLPIGVGGVLYPPNSVNYRVFNIDVFLEHCFLADDIWLNIMARLNNTNVSKTSYESHYLPIMYKYNSTLNSLNVEENLNDKQLMETRNYCIEKWGIDPFKDLIRSYSANISVQS